MKPGAVDVGGDRILCAGSFPCLFYQDRDFLGRRQLFQFLDGTGDRALELGNVG